MADVLTLLVRRYLSKRRVLTFLLICGALFFTPQLLLMLRFKGQIHANLNGVPPREYGIVFGARVGEDGRLSDVARERVAAAVLLHQQGKVRKLFISGDNRHHQEVEAMARHAIERGLPEGDLILDHLGIDTNDTCRHFKAVSHEATLITQSFHLPRALFMCEQSRVGGVGLAANELGLLASRGDNLAQVYGIRLSRFLRESLLTWLFIVGLYDHLSDEAEMMQQGN